MASFDVTFHRIQYRQQTSFAGTIPEQNSLPEAVVTTARPWTPLNAGSTATSKSLLVTLFYSVLFLFGLPAVLKVGLLKG